MLEGDFSYFAGYYEGISGDENTSSVMLDKNGVLTENRGWYTSKKPLSITVTETGSIHCVIEPRWVETYYDGEIVWAEFFDICPIGVQYCPNPDFSYPVFPTEQYGTDTVRIMYADVGGSAGGDRYQYHKVY